jgi:hypothetical protein
MVEKNRIGQREKSKYAALCQSFSQHSGVSGENIGHQSFLMSARPLILPLSQWLDVDCSRKGMTTGKI